MITLTNKEEFAKEIIDVLNTKGFGSLNKNDWEVLIFSLLKRFGSLHDKKSNHHVSLELQIPETKVKRLAYEANLKYHFKEINDITESFKGVLKEVYVIKDKGKDIVKFAVEDQFLKNAIAAKLKELRYYADYSFNSEIVSIRIDAFVKLMQAFYPKLNEAITLNKIASENHIKLIDDDSVNLQKLLIDLVSVTESGEKVIRIGSSILNYIRNK